MPVAIDDSGDEPEDQREMLSCRLLLLPAVLLGCALQEHGLQSADTAGEALQDADAIPYDLPDATPYSAQCLSRLYRTLRAGVYHHERFEVTLDQIDELPPRSFESQALAYFQQTELSGQVLAGDSLSVLSVATESIDGSEGGHLVEIATRATTSAYVIDQGRQLIAQLADGEVDSATWYCDSPVPELEEDGPEPACARDFMLSIPHYPEVGTVENGRIVGDEELPHLIGFAVEAYRRQVGTPMNEALDYDALSWDSVLWDSGAEVLIAGEDLPAITFVVAGSNYEQRILLQSDGAGLHLDCTGSRE